MKKILFSLILTSSLASGLVHAGGVPVGDVISNGRLAATVIKLDDQLKGMKKHLEAIQGTSNLADILKSAGPEIHKLYPELAEQLQNIDSFINSGYEIKNQVETIKSQLQAISSKDLFNERLSPGRFWYEEKAKHIFTNMAINQQAMTVTTERKKVFETLRDKIGDAEDPKAKQDLLLNINIEILQVMNDLVHTLQVQQQMQLNDQNVEHNNWARSRQIQTKMADVKLSD